MEIEYFFDPEDDWNKQFESWLEYMYGFMDMIGLSRSKMHNHEIPDGERAFYSKRTIDMEYDFPFGQDELWAIAYRTNFDLSRHQKFSNENLEYYDQEAKRKFIPHVIEPTFGLDRTLLAVLSTAYQEETLENGESRVVLRLHKNIAPYKVAVFPLVKNKSDLVNKAMEIFDDLKTDFMCEFDDNGNIGKRYRRQDEIGTPFCVTIDYDTLEKNTVTVRDRDTMKQERISLEELKNYFKDKLK